MDASPTRSKTITLNVGGRHFEVSRFLVELQPESMLARMVSLRWQGDDEERLFIDRNGDTFGAVLDYLRYGSVVLPSVIPTDMFLRDLDFYGLEYDTDEIKDGDKVVADLKEAVKQAEEKLEEEWVTKANDSKLIMQLSRKLEMLLVENEALEAAI